MRPSSSGLRCALSSRRGARWPFKAGGLSLLYSGGPSPLRAQGAARVYIPRARAHDYCVPPSALPPPPPMNRAHALSLSLYFPSMVGETGVGRGPRVFEGEGGGLYARARGRVCVSARTTRVTYDLKGVVSARPKLVWSRGMGRRVSREAAIYRRELRARGGVSTVHASGGMYRRCVCVGSIYICARAREERRVSRGIGLAMSRRDCSPKPYLAARNSSC